MSQIDMQIQGELCRQEMLQTRLAALHVKNNSGRPHTQHVDQEIASLENALATCCNTLRRLFDLKCNEEACIDQGMLN